MFMQWPGSRAAPIFSGSDPPLPIGRKRQVMHRVNSCAVFVLILVLTMGLMCVLAGASPVAAAPIEIDATQLVYRYFIIPGVTPQWLESRSTVRTLNLPTGRYHFQFASGYYADFSFDVSAQGTVDYDPAFDVFLQGRGTSRLTIVGHEVRLDARYLSGSGILLVVPSTPDDWIVQQTVRMVPASFYSVQQGSGQVASFTFRLGVDGRFSYDPAFDVARGGFLAGQGTATLQFLGYPLLVDGRRAGGVGLTIQPIWGMPFTFTQVQFADLLPASRFVLQTESGVLTQGEFSLDTRGGFHVDSALASLLRLSRFHGLNRLEVLAPLPRRP